MPYDKEEFEKAVQAEVERVLSSREEAQARQEAEEALAEASKVFEALKASIEEKDAKIEEYEKALAALDNSEPTDAEVAANDRVVTLENELQEQKNRAEVAEAALNTLAREETAAGRMAELTESGVALDEENAEMQYAKVRDMSDEEFESYKSELVALKSKYASSSEEEGEDTTEVARLPQSDINLIAQSLGCDPADSECISLVNEVAQKVAEVSNSRKISKDDASQEDAEEASEDKNEQMNKEVASAKMSICEGISKAMDQEIRPSQSLLDENTQAWEEYYAKKRREKSE